MPLSPTELLTVIAIAKKEAEKVIPEFRQPIDGTDGIDGRDGVDGRDGIDGINGRDGKDGLDGKDGRDGENGRDGIDGKDGLDGVDGRDGRDGAKGNDGKDGVGIDELAIGDDGHLYVGLTSGKVIDAGRARGKDGKDGKDGRTVIGMGGGGNVASIVSSPLQWIDYVSHWDVEPLFVSDGIYSYTWDGVTRYRLVPDPYNAAADGFYSGFSGGVLSGLITTRGN